MYTARYLRQPRLLQEITIARADGRYAKLLGELERTDVLVFDDWGLAALTDEQRRDLLEVLDYRFNVRSTLVTVVSYHSRIGMTTSAIRPWPKPFSSASCTVPTSSVRLESRCANTRVI